VAQVGREARQHPAALPVVPVTSAEKGMDIPELRAAVRRRRDRLTGLTRIWELDAFSASVLSLGWGDEK
jgi:hypothetical protein